MAREQRLLGEDVAQFLSRLESQPVPAAAAMALTMQQLVDSTFPVSGEQCCSYVQSHERVDSGTGSGGDGAYHAAARELHLPGECTSP